MRILQVPPFVRGTFAAHKRSKIWYNIGHQEELGYDGNY